MLVTVGPILRRSVAAKQAAVVTYVSWYSSGTVSPMPIPQKPAASAARAALTDSRELRGRLMTPSLTCVSLDRRPPWRLPCGLHIV